MPIQRTLVSTGSDRNLIVLRKGSANDGSSFVTLEALRDLRLVEGIARNAAGEPLVSPELVVQPFFHRPEGGRENVLVRGVESVALYVHDEVTILEGRMLYPSSGEAIVGRIGSFGNAAVLTAVGDTVNVARRIEEANKMTGTRMLISDAAAREAGEAVMLGGHFDVELAGKADRHTLVEVLGMV